MSENVFDGALNRLCRQYESLVRCHGIFLRVATLSNLELHGKLIFHLEKSSITKHKIVDLINTNV
jgi:hypothetical protein